MELRGTAGGVYENQDQASEWVLAVGVGHL